MQEILCRITACTLLLLLIPTTVWLSGWQWQPDASKVLLHYLFWMTETVTRPWGTMTNLLLSFWVLWCLNFRLKPAVLLFLIMNTTILTGQYANSYIKDQVQEARPYIVWLEHNHGLDNREFYHLTHKERSQYVDQLLASAQIQPFWLRQHWIFETGFAFPSGHTLFATSWILLMVGLLWPRRHYITIGIVGFWTIAVMISRLLLGMHWPGDLAMALLLSWLLVMIAIWLVHHFCGPVTLQVQDRKKVMQRKSRL
ncbi:phosphatidylglycerophosphatase B [Pantoea sp. Nvir]|uniref:phosphatidylglycerophosphatase B n=1 Tax=Pantoea sp. Nvir TaxID=2576760 RepID=UPI0013571329|nr:phosphatidylglycerophosphatase B [Pantoea sp. Nvir]MXP66180.1 phosphatidylglycerophosphatase B [Pantoea sp. Nvir]